MRARAQYRDYDGVVRPVTRYGATRPRAEAALKEALRDRTTRATGHLDARTRRPPRCACEQPIRDIARMTRPRKHVRALTKDEAAKLRAALHADDAAVQLDLPDLVDFMLGTGLRIGEACAVRWSAVDLAAGVLEVNSTVVRTKEYGLVVQERPKSSAGWRVIALPPSIVELLSRRQSGGAAMSGVVFRSPLGQIRHRSNTTGDLRRALDRAGFDWVSSHTFRKTVATRLDAGLTARQIADDLGRARPSLTQDVYLGRNVVSSQAASVLDF